MKMKEKKTNRPHFWRNPRWRYGGMSTLILCVLLAALLALNLVMGALEKKNGWRVDYSFNAVTTQSDATLQILAELPHPVHIYALYSKGAEDGLLIELLNRYAAASDLVTWEQTDVSLNPGLVTRFQGASSDDVVTNDSLIVYCEATERWKILNPLDFYSLGFNYEEGKYEFAGLTYEGKITSAIHYVTQENIPRVVISQGHGELDEGSTAVLADLLSSNNYDVQYLSLSSAETALNPEEDLLALLSPVRDLTDEELAAVMVFVEEGGSILFTCDYTDPVEQMPNYSALLRSYGFIPKDGLVIASSEEPDTYYNVRTYVIPTMQAAESTYSLVQDGADILLLAGSRAFEIPEDSDRSLTVTPVLTSSYKAYLHDSTSESLSIEQTDDDELGPFAMALEARRITASGNASRAFVLGCSTLLTSSQIHAMTDSQEFIIRVAEYLLDTQPIDLNIMAKTAVRPQLSVESATLGSILLVALPLAVLAAALIVLAPRRHR